MCKCSGMCPNPEAPGLQGHIEDMSVYGTKNVLQCSMCDDSLKGITALICIETIKYTVNAPVLNVEDLVKLLQ